MPETNTCFNYRLKLPCLNYPFKLHMFEVHLLQIRRPPQLGVRGFGYVSHKLTISYSHSHTFILHIVFWGEFEGDVTLCQPCQNQCLYHGRPRHTAGDHRGRAQILALDAEREKHPETTGSALKTTGGPLKTTEASSRAQTFGP